MPNLEALDGSGDCSKFCGNGIGTGLSFNEIIFSYGLVRRFADLFRLTTVAIRSSVCLEEVFLLPSTSLKISYFLLAYRILPSQLVPYTSRDKTSLYDLFDSIYNTCMP